MARRGNLHQARARSPRDAGNDVWGRSRRKSKSPALWRGAFFTAAGLGPRRAKEGAAQQWTPLRITAPTRVGDSESDETAKLQLEG